MPKHDNKYGAERFSYLQELVKEFQQTNNQTAKQQVLANLGNFAYDPNNFEHLYRLNATDIFLDNVTDQEMTEHAIAGLCNLAADERNRDYIVNHDGLNLLTTCLSSENEETVISAMTLLLQLAFGMPEKTFSSELVESMLQFSYSSNKRLANLATLFVKNHCTEQHLQTVDKLKNSLRSS